MPIAYPYKFSDWYDYDKDCVNTTPFNVGTSSGSAGAMCTQQSPGANTYHHSGSTTYPSVNDIVYTDAAATTPLNGGSGLNWPYFAAGVAPGTSPVGYFRITGSTGAVQSISSCP